MTFRVGIVRGIPMLVILYYLAFAGAQDAAPGLNLVTQPAELCLSL